MADIEQVRDFWDEHICGDVFTSLTERTSQEYLDEVRRKRYHYEYHLMPFLRRVAATGGPVLEIGCSIGMDLAELAAMGVPVVGVDLSPKSIEVARRHFELRRLPAQLQVANAEKLEFPDATFAAVYSFGVLHHTPDIHSALREVHRVLRPRGKAFLMLYSRYSLNNLVHVLFRLPYESPRDRKADAPVTRTFSKRRIRRHMHRFTDVLRRGLAADLGHRAAVHQRRARARAGMALDDRSREIRLSDRSPLARPLPMGYRRRDLSASS